MHNIKIQLLLNTHTLHLRKMHRRFSTAIFTWLSICKYPNNHHPSHLNHCKLSQKKMAEQLEEENQDKQMSAWTLFFLWWVHGLSWTTNIMTVQWDLFRYHLFRCMGLLTYCISAKILRSQKKSFSMNTYHCTQCGFYCQLMAAERKTDETNYLLRTCNF